jgi:hypothetical protein
MSGFRRGVAGVGRQTKCTPDLQERVCKALSFGVEVEVACALEGISRDSFYDWRARGRNGEEPYAGFLEATEQALLRVDLALHGTVLSEAVGNRQANRAPNWQAAAWYLKFRKTGGSQKVELTGKDGAPLQGALTQESADLIRQKILFGDTKKKPEPTGEGEP